MTKYLNIPMDRYYYDKKNCVESAEAIIKEEKITGMTKRQIAAELYAHAFIYFNFQRIPKIIRETSFAKRMYESTANGIDLEDNGDTIKRRIFYAFVYSVC